MLADCRQVANGSNESVAHVPWVRARESHTLDSRHGADARQKLREVAVRVVRRLVVVDDLAEQLNLEPARVHGRSHFVENLRYRPHPFVAARVRHHAERAELIAAFDDGDPRAHGIRVPGHSQRERHVVVRTDVDRPRRDVPARSAPDRGRDFSACVPTMTSIDESRLRRRSPSCCATHPVTAITGSVPVSAASSRNSPRRV